MCVIVDLCMDTGDPCSPGQGWPFVSCSLDSSLTVYHVVYVWVLFVWWWGVMVIIPHFL